MYSRRASCRPRTVSSMVTGMAMVSLAGLLLSTLAQPEFPLYEVKLFVEVGGAEPVSEQAPPRGRALGDGVPPPLGPRRNGCKERDLRRAVGSRGPDFADLPSVP